MYKRSLTLKKILLPASPTEVFSLLAILVGVLIAIFLTELPIRLIGVCISILGGVGHFMLLSQRLSDSFEPHRPVPVSQPTQLHGTVVSGQGGKRIIFDGYDFDNELEQNTSAIAEENADTKSAAAPSSAISGSKSTSANTPIAGNGRSGNNRTAAVKAAEPNAPSNGSLQGRIGAAIEADEAEEGIRIIRTTGGKTQAKSTVKPAPVAQTIAQPNPAASPVHEDVVNVLTEQESIAEPAAPIEALPDTMPVELIGEISEVIEETPLISAPEPEIANHKRAKLEISLQDFMEEQEPTPTEPRKEFDYLLARVLMVIRSVINARTAAFFWVNHDKKQLVSESYISDVRESFTNARKLPFGNDVVSQIAVSGKPEILTEIQPSAELDLLPYYSTPTGTFSFIGVPVYFNGMVVGVLCADSTQADAYDAITVGFLGHFTKLITGLVQSYTGKYDLLQANRALDAISRFRTIVSTNGNGMAELCAALLESASHAVDFYTMGIGLFDHTAGQWTVYQVFFRNQEAETMLGQPISLEHSLIGQTILSGRSTVIYPVQEGIIRVTAQEPAHPGGYFASVPLRSQSHNYGALFLEGPASMSPNDLTIIEMLGEQTGTIIEQLRFHDILRSSALMNEQRGVFNANAFSSRLGEETLRTKDFNTPLSLALIRMDSYNSLDSSPGVSEELMLHIIKHIRQNMREYDILGEVDEKTLSIALIGQKNDKAKFWAERVRKEIASSIRDIGGKRFTVTVSIGIAEAAQYDNPQNLLRNATTALDLAAGKSNTVKVFS
jgi:diguanylate cyclase (GGDEF)-like protein